MEIFTRSLGSFRGLAIGDALGAPVEFLPKGTFPKVTNYAESPHFRIGPGDWTDDTIMAICLAESLAIESGYNSLEVMKLYQKWFEEGYTSPNGEVFDIGIQTARALREFSQTPEKSLPTNSAGNGTIMRLAPAVISTLQLPLEEACKIFEISARDTHNSDEAAEATVYFGLLLRELIRGEEFEEALQWAAFELEEYWPNPITVPDRVSYRSEEEVTPSGYVIETLAAAIWAVTTSQSFSEAVLKAVNLGGDADTVGAVTGQLAGALYTDVEIPEEWKENLYRTDDFVLLTASLLEQSKGLIYSREYS